MTNEGGLGAADHPVERALTPMERLLQEELPTGTFGDAAPVRPRAHEAAPDPNAAAHRAQLLAALGSAPLDVHGRTGKRRHLQAVPPTAAA